MDRHLDPSSLLRLSWHNGYIPTITMEMAMLGIEESEWEGWVKEM